MLLIFSAITSGVNVSLVSRTGIAEVAAAVIARALRLLHNDLAPHLAARAGHDELGRNVRWRLQCPPPGAAWKNHPHVLGRGNLPSVGAHRGYGQNLAISGAAVPGLQHRRACRVLPRGPAKFGCAFGFGLAVQWEVESKGNLGSEEHTSALQSLRSI